MRYVLLAILLVACDCGKKDEPQPVENLTPDAGCKPISEVKRKAGAYMDLVKPIPIPAGNERPCTVWTFEAEPDVPVVEYRCTADHSTLLPCDERASACYHVATAGFVCDYGWWALK